LPEQLTVAIPTFERGEYVIETVRELQRQTRRAGEILVVDQTAQHPRHVDGQLEQWHARGDIVWIRLSKPSVPMAMNQALLRAKYATVLFLDDDIVPSASLIEAHTTNYVQDRAWAVVGQILQPGQSPELGNVARPKRPKNLWEDLDFPFNGNRRQEVANCMAGNFSVRRDRALQVGGFDENFIGVAYRFETEFCRRLLQQGGTVVFEPKASIRHLQAASGGSRARVDQPLRSSQPDHSVGDYYFALRQGVGVEKYSYTVNRMFRSVRTTYHLKHPWWIPVKLVGECRGLLLARRMARRGPSLLVSDNCPV